MWLQGCGVAVAVMGALHYEVLGATNEHPAEARPCAIMGWS